MKKAIATVLSGESYFSNELLRKIIYNIGKSVDNLPDKKILTSREIEVLKEICNGFTNEEIGKKLFISAKTVKGHRSNLLAKTNCKNSASLVMYAIKNKYVKL